MGERLFTDKLVLRWLEVLDAWSLDSATPVILANPVHESGSSMKTPTHSIRFIR